MDLYTDSFNNSYELLENIHNKNYGSFKKNLYKNKKLINKILFIKNYKDLYNFFLFLKRKELNLLKDNFLFFLEIIIKNIKNKKSLYKSLNYLITKDNFFKQEILNFYSYKLAIKNNNVAFLNYLIENKIEISNKLLIKFLNENKEKFLKNEKLDLYYHYLFIKNNNINYFENYLHENNIAPSNKLLIKYLYENKEYLNIFKIIINKTNIIDYYDNDTKYNIINYLIKFKKKKYLNYLFFHYQNKNKIKTLLQNINKENNTIFSQEEHYIIKNLNFIKIIENFNINYKYVLGVDKSLIDELINNIIKEKNPKIINKYYKILKFIIKKYDISQYTLKWKTSENIVDELEFLLNRDTYKIQDKKGIYKYKKLINFMVFNNIYFNNETFFDGRIYYFLMKYTYYPLDKTKILENKYFLNNKHYIEIKKYLINKINYLLNTNKQNNIFFIKLKILSKNLKIVKSIIDNYDKDLFPF